MTPFTIRSAEDIDAFIDHLLGEGRNIRKSPLCMIVYAFHQIYTEIENDPEGVYRLTGEKMVHTLGVSHEYNMSMRYLSYSIGVFEPCTVDGKPCSRPLVSRDEAVIKFYEYLCLRIPDDQLELEF